ncbi:N-6 DNA methylase, partial [uncultured Rothia sp.]|uniref:N-6 DNA methylase n=1 Tax=uncultured Rothia sp. TaxID=316088 RepID=UPI0025F19709
MAKNVLGQYFTPSHIARIMVDLIESPQESKILEPSAGEGVFLDVLHEAGYSNIEGIEIDSSLKQNVMHTVYHESFVSWMKDGEYSAVIGNPPYIRWKNLEE